MNAIITQGGFDNLVGVVAQFDGAVCNPEVVRLILP